MMYCMLMLKLYVFFNLEKEVTVWDHYKLAMIDKIFNLVVLNGNSIVICECHQKNID